MLPRSWIIRTKNPPDIIQALLENREITDRERFLHPLDPATFSYKELGFSAVQLKRAGERLEQALTQKECVVIYGDYDVDGVSATSLMWLGLHKLGFTVFPFIPDRFVEGYGMSILGIDRIQEKYPEVKLIITVDNGIVANAAITEASARGIDVIVTDHHEKDEPIKAKAVVHTTALCGSGVVWFFLKWLFENRESVDQRWLDSMLDIVGMATVSDQMKLIGVNRSLAFHGIRRLRKTTNIGLQALGDVCGIDITTVGTYEIGFLLGARMNAAGRVSHAIDVVRLLCTKDRKKANQIAQDLNTLNLSRQDILEEVLQSARSQVVATDRIIVVSGEFHEGVIGLAAGRIMEETGKPTIVIGIGETHAKGSARSISGFHITDALRSMKDLLINVGGHEMAAGFSIETSQIDRLRSQLADFVKPLLTDETLRRKLVIDCELPLNRVDISLAQELNQMEPFGTGNPPPLFASKKVMVSAVKPLGKTGAHIKLVISANDTSQELLLFQIGRYEKVPKVGEYIDVVYSISHHLWNGRYSLEMIIKDFKVHDTGTAKTRKKIQNPQKARRRREKN